MALSEAIHGLSPAPKTPIGRRVLTVWYAGAKARNNMWYWLHDDHSVSPAPDTNDPAFKEYNEWAFGGPKNNRMLASTMTTRGHLVSTIFLALDHSYTGKGAPILFETMVFPDGIVGAEEDSERYCTWDEAMEGHNIYVDKYGGAVIQEPATAQGAREYEEIMNLPKLDPLLKG